MCHSWVHTLELTDTCAVWFGVFFVYSNGHPPWGSRLKWQVHVHWVVCSFLQVAVSARQMGSPLVLPPPGVHTAAEVIEIYCEEINPQFYQDPYVVAMPEDINPTEE